jgi:hypothetical protein
MRGRMSDAASYAPPVEIEVEMIGGSVSRVERSLHPDYQAGELVLSFNNWQDCSLSDGTDNPDYKTIDNKGAKL